MIRKKAIAILTILANINANQSVAMKKTQYAEEYSKEIGNEIAQILFTGSGRRAQRSHKKKEPNQTTKKMIQPAITLHKHIQQLQETCHQLDEIQYKNKRNNVAKTFDEDLLQNILDMQRSFQKFNREIEQNRPIIAIFNQLEPPTIKEHQKQKELGEAEKLQERINEKNKIAKELEKQIEIQKKKLLKQGTSICKILREDLKKYEKNDTPTKNLKKQEKNSTETMIKQLENQTKKLKREESYLAISRNRHAKNHSIITLLLNKIGTLQESDKKKIELEQLQKKLNEAIKSSEELNKETAIHKEKMLDIAQSICTIIAE